MSTSDMGKAIEIALAVTRKYADKNLALQKNLSVAATGEDYALLREIIQQYIQEAAKLQANLQDALAKVVEMESYQARQARYGERWWQQKRQALYEAFKEDPQKGLSQWLQTYAEALIAWELAVCKKLVSEPFPFPEEQTIDMLTLFRNGMQAIEDETYLQALDVLMYLTQATSATQPQPILDEISRAMLLIFMGRIYLYIASESEAALKFFEQARVLAPNFGLPCAAVGSYYQTQHDSSQPLSLYQQAIELSPHSPDGYIGMGLLSEERASWDEADDWYEEAIEAVREEKDIWVALSKLLTPVSGNLYLQLARTLRKQDPERALRVAERAITTGIKRDGDYPERFAYKLKGEILEDLGRSSDAAEAHYEAGKRFFWRDEYTTAVEILTHANDLNLKHIPIYWLLSDALRMSSYQTIPPFVDKDSIQRSLAIWEQGYKLEPPGNDYSWSYLTRALMNEQLYHLPEFTHKQWTLWWEAITYVERAILYTVDAPTWTFLARYYRYLEEEASARQAVVRALDLEPENIAALEEHASILADVGEVEAAEEAIDKLQTLESLTWLDGLKAYNLLYKGLLKEDKGSYEEAVKILDHSLQASSVKTITDTATEEKLQTTQRTLQARPEEIWYHDLRADCYLRLNETLRAREDFEWNWKQYKQWSNTEMLNEFGWAAYSLAWTSGDRDSSFYDYINQAIEIFTRLCQEPAVAGNAYRNLGLSYLTRSDMIRDDLALGEESLNKGIALATNKRELDEVQNVDFFNIEKVSANQPHEAQVREILARLNERINTRRIQLEQGRTVEEELKEVIKTYPPSDSRFNWAWLGAQAGLARLYTEEKRWSEAVAAYLLLQKGGERFLEAHLGLEKIFDELQTEGNDCVKKGKPHEAIEKFTQILKLELLPNDRTRQAQLYSCLGYAYFELVDIDNTRKHFVKALQLYHENGTPNPGSALSEVCRSLLRDATHYWNLDAGWNAMADDPNMDEILRSDLAAARRSLANYPDELYQLAEQYADKSKMLPVVTPIYLELGQGLIPEDTSQEWSLFKFYIPGVKQRIQDGIGIKLPGIQVRANEALSSEAYSILLDEALLIRSSVYLDMRYCPASPETVSALGISKEVLIQSAHPLTGEPGCWIQRDNWDSVINNNLELWAEPLVFIIYHLEAVLLRNLARLLHIQEVENLLSEWTQSQDASSLIVSALPDQHARYHFTQVLRALVREQVPIKSWKDILETFKEAGLINVDVSEAVRVIRLRLREQLPGNNLDAQRLELPSKWEDIFISGLVYKNGRTFLTVPPEEPFRFLSSVRNAVNARDLNLVLVTQNSEIRPFVQRLVENEFPRLMVLAQDELMVVGQTAVVEQAKGVVSDAE